MMGGMFGVVLVLFVFSGERVSQRVPDRLLDSLLTAGIDQTLRQAYDQAATTFQRVSQEFPDHPSGFLYQAAILQAVAMDYELHIDREPFDSLLRLAEERAQGMIERSPDSPWGYFYRGTSEGYDSFARAQRGDWFGAATKGMASAGDFQKAVDRDSLFYDAYAGIGTYYYWKTRKIEFLTWLPFVGDKREEGIRMLHRSLRKGGYNRFAALTSLIAIYLDSGQLEEAQHLAEEGLEAYPDNRIFLWGLATALDRNARVAEAHGAYKRLLTSIKRDARSNPYNELVCRLNLIKAGLAAGTTEQWDEQLRELLNLRSLAFPRHLEKRAKEKFEEAEKLYKKLVP